jgi:nucleotidyltransferase substrate binding protein (TIGR01987 family)
LEQTESHRARVELYRSKVEKYKKALIGFNKLFERDLSLFDEVINDALRNGQIHKFEYCSELMWKSVKMLLSINNNVTPRSPRDSIKEFLNCGYINAETYETMTIMLDDRNRLSHMYKDDILDEVYARLQEYKTTMNKVLTILEEVTIS